MRQELPGKAEGERLCHGGSNVLQKHFKKLGYPLMIFKMYFSLNNFFSKFNNNFHKSNA